VKWLGRVAVISTAMALTSHHFLHIPVLTFVTAAVSLFILSKYLGEAAEQMSLYVGENTAGLLNASVGNLAELVIVFMAIKANMLDLVQADIVGSIIGNLLLVMGLSIYLGCRRHKTMQFNGDIGGLFMNQFYLVMVVLMSPTVLNGKLALPHWFSGALAVLLVSTYVYYLNLSRTDERFRTIKEQSQRVEQHWSKRFSIKVIVICSIGVFFNSELLVDEVSSVATALHFSEALIGFIILPLVGNLAENLVAVHAARKGMVELSLSVSVGSASQVGMIIAPCAVVFGLLTGNYFTLRFTIVPLFFLLVSIFGALLVLHDQKWNINEGVMLMVLYAVMLSFCVFAR
jgi:Ca2+:H+ antiporter